MDSYMTFLFFSPLVIKNITLFLMDGSSSLSQIPFFSLEGAKLRLLILLVFYKWPDLLFLTSVNIYSIFTHWSFT